MTRKPDHARIERAWRAWLDLTQADRSEFFVMVRERLADEHERARHNRGSTLAADRRVDGLRRLSIDAAELMQGPAGQLRRY